MTAIEKKLDYKIKNSLTAKVILASILVLLFIILPIVGSLMG